LNFFEKFENTKIVNPYKSTTYTDDVHLVTSGRRLLG